MAGIIWLASYPKSGNTWSRLFFENLLTDGDEEVNINSTKNFITGDTSVRWWMRFTGGDVSQMTDAETMRRRPEALTYLSSLSTGGVILKTHCACARYLNSHLVSPDHTSGAIYIVRNPLDIVLSLANFWGISTLETIRRMGRTDVRLLRDKNNVSIFMSSWANHVHSWTRRPHPRLLVVRYEDMLSDPMKSFDAMVRHVGLSPNRDQMTRAIENSSFEKLKAQESRSGFIEAPEGRKFFRSGRAGQWKSELKPRLVERLVRDQGAVMEKFGYLPAGTAARKPLPTLRDDSFPPFECGQELIPPGNIYRPVDSPGFNIRM
ncbi:MAG: sulfotransferase domain-containing protein [Alphaproteobacteria bacterium]|nr:sulfotransferase domain-containing protein [Alphaproteobacteria bacterium]